MSAERKSGEQPDFIFDRLYERLEFTPDDLRLFQTKELTRLRQVSLSATPTWIVPAGICATKFEHSVGVWHLARVVGQRPEFCDFVKDLAFAALAHDLGTPPFSHASERFLMKLIGKNHEEFAEDVLDNSEFSREVERQGGSPEIVTKLVKGEYKPLSDIINGSIDLDNLDNSLRYGLSMGLFREHLYSPENLAQAFAMRGGRLVLLPGYDQDLEGWEECRRKVYKFGSSPANMSPGMMMVRAMDFAVREGEIKRDFFFKNDAEAFSYLVTECNPRTKILVEMVQKWMFYSRIFNFSTSQPTDYIMDFFSDVDNRGILADEISSLLKAPPEEVCVYLGKDKGFKRIHIPILDDRGEEQERPAASELAWMAQVYVHPRWAGRSERVSEFMKERLE